MNQGGKQEEETQKGKHDKTANTKHCTYISTISNKMV